jgi:thiosulfate/3-mercaptopyruvate sulfurtransferase
MAQSGIRAFSTIVSVAELASHIGDRDWLVVDCRHSLADAAAGKAAYDAGHIPGAFFAAVETDLSGAKTGTNGRHPLPESAAFQRFLRRLGAHGRTQIVAYDAGGDMFAARMWFLLKYVGHEAAAVLDGGIAAWNAAGMRLEQSVPREPDDGTIAVHPRPDLIVDTTAVEESLRSRSFALLDARGADRFAGENETIDPVAGHIPGAFNRSFRLNFASDGRLKSPEDLRAEFSAFTLPAERLVHQCGSGVSAAVNMLAMEHAGMAGTRLYPGSWSEWCSNPSRPVER